MCPRARKPVAAYGVEPHQDRDQDDERTPQRRRAAVTAKPCDRGQLAELERHAHADDRNRGADEHGRHAGDGKAGRHSGQRQCRHRGRERNASTASPLGGDRRRVDNRGRYGSVTGKARLALGPVPALAQGVTGGRLPRFGGRADG